MQRWKHTLTIALLTGDAAHENDAYLRGLECMSSAEPHRVMILDVDDDKADAVRNDRHFFFLCSLSGSVSSTFTASNAIPVATA